MRILIMLLLATGLAVAQGPPITVKMVSPTAADCDLQIICVFKHNPAGDKYIEAMQDFDTKLGQRVSQWRNSGAFVGELGETFLFTTPPNSITPPKVLLIGLGDEKSLSLDTLKVVGRVALREAVRQQARRVSFAPTIRDQGNTTLNVGDGDAIVAEQVMQAYATEKRLQQEGLAPQFDITEWVIDAGPKFFEDATAKVTAAVARQKGGTP